MIIRIVRTALGVVSPGLGDIDFLSYSELWVKTVQEKDRNARNGPTTIARQPSGGFLIAAKATVGSRPFRIQNS